MIPTKIDMSDESISKKIQNNNARNFATNLKLFANHNGLRRNKMHLLIAPTGVGKSTFTRTMILDFVLNNPDMKMLLWLTEETVGDFEEEFAKCANSVKVNYEKLDVVSEQDLHISEGTEAIKKYIKDSVEYNKYDVVIVDNITTSKMYLSANPSSQADIAGWLKMFCKRNLALFVIAHTGANVADGKLLDENDIRGSKAITTLTEFLYILQPFYVGSRLFQFFVTKKSRSQPVQSKYIGMKYNKDTSTFCNGAYVNFDDMKGIFKKRNRLNEK